MTATITIAPLQPLHRSQIEEIVRATGVFTEGETRVALELFDEALAAGGRGQGAGDVSIVGAAAPPAASRLPPADYEVLGAFDDDRLIGYACFGATPSTDRTYDLYWIAVHPEAQCGGVGGALISEVERQLDERRARMLIVETSSRDDYAPTRRFYQKRGFQETARLHDFYAPGDDRVVLAKRLVAVPNAQGADSHPYPLPAAYE